MWHFIISSVKELLYASSKKNVFSYCSSCYKKKCKKEEEEVIAIKKLIVQDISICNATIVEIITKHQPKL